MFLLNDCALLQERCKVLDFCQSIAIIDYSVEEATRGVTNPGRRNALLQSR